MSHSVQCTTEFCDPRVLVAALTECRFTADQIEIHAEAVPPPVNLEAFDPGAAPSALSPTWPRGWLSQGVGEPGAALAFRRGSGYSARCSGRVSRGAGFAVLSVRWQALSVLCSVSGPRRPLGEVAEWLKATVC